MASYEELLARLQQAAGPSPTYEETSNKLQKLQEASERKRDALNKAYGEQLQSIERNKDSWVSQAGLDPDGAAGAGLNLLASGTSGMARMAGTVLGTQFGGERALTQHAAMTQQEIEAVNAVKAGTATPEQAQLANTKRMFPHEYDTRSMAELSPLEVREQVLKNIDNARTIYQAGNKQHWVHQGNREALNKDWDADFDKVEQQFKAGKYAQAAGSTALSLGKSFVNHPMAALEMTAENLPQLAVAMLPGGTALVGGTNIAMAAENSAKGMEKGAKKGELISAEDARYSQSMGLAGAALEQASDVIGAGLLKAAGKGASKEAVKDAAKQTLKESLANVGKAFGKGVVSEMPIEAAQTYTEGEAQLESASARDIFKGAMAGGLVGGTLGGGASLVGETGVQLAKAGQAATDKKGNTPKEVVEARNAAIESGDLTGLTDSQSKTFSPADAVFALHQIATKENTSDEVKQAKVAEASGIIADLEAKKNDTQLSLLSKDKDALKEQIQKFKDAEAKATDPARKAALQEQIELFTAELNDPEAQFDVAKAKQYRAQLEKLDAQLAQARNYMAKFTEEVGLHQANATEAIARIESSAQSPDPVDISKDVNTVLSLSMVSPNQVSAEQARTLASNQNVALTPQQRTYLEAFAKVREQLDDVSGVHTEAILGTGNKSRTGLEEHHARVGAALMSGDAGRIQTAMKNLDHFTKDRASKNEAVQAALAMSKQRGGEKAQAIRVGPNTWELNTGPLRQRANKYDDSIVDVLAHNANSLRMVEEIQKEQEVSASLASAMKAAAALKVPQATQATPAPQKAAVEAPGAQAQEISSPSQPAPVTPAAPAQPTQSAQAQNSPSQVAPETKTKTKTKTETETETETETKTEGEVKAATSNVAPQSNIAKAANEANTIVDQLTERSKAKGTNKTYQLPSEVQTNFINRILSKLPANVQKLAKAVTFVIETGPSSGMYYSSLGVIGLNLDKAKDPSSWHESMNGQQRVAWTIAHELGHAQDRNTLLGSHTSFGLSKGWVNALFWDQHDNGKSELLDELKNVKDSFGQWVASYPLAILGDLDPNSPEAKKATMEVVAQLLAFKHFNEGKFNELFPKNSAWLSNALESSKNHGNQTNGSKTMASRGEGVRRDGGDARNIGDAETTTSAQEDPRLDPNSPEYIPPLESLDEATPVSRAPEITEATTEVQTTTVKEQSTEDSTTTSTVEPEATTDEDTEVEQGTTVDGITQFNKEAKEYSSLAEAMKDVSNRFSTLFKQAKNKSLAKYKDFNKKLYAGDIKLVDLLGRDPSDKEFKLIKSFSRFAIQNDEGFANLFYKRTDAYAYTDLSQSFFNDDGTIDENVATAMSYAAFDWMANAATNEEIKSYEQLAQINGIDEGNFSISNTTYDQIKSVESLRSTAINTLGRTAVRAMGIKAGKDTPQDLINKIETTLGLMILQKMIADKLVSVVTLDNDAVRELSGAEIVGGKDEEGRNLQAYKRDFIQLNRTPQMEVLRPLYRAGQLALRNVFQDDAPLTQSSWEPIPFDAKNAKRSMQLVPQHLKKVLSEAQAVPHKVIPVMWDLAQAMGMERILGAMGAVDLGENGQGDGLSAITKKGAIAKNKSIKHQYDTLVESMQRATEDGKGIDQEWYLPQEVWQNLRVGMASRDINLQSYKLHRFMFSRPEWESTIKMDDIKTLQHFGFAVYAAAGGKTDKQSNRATLKKIKEWRESKEGKLFAAASLAIHKAYVAKDGTVLTDAQLDRISQIARDSEGAQTLQAMTAYGAYLYAKETKATDFTTTMLVGVDGKTNGPILTFLALGAEITSGQLKEVLKAGGFYTRESGEFSFGSWFAKGNQDMYERVAASYREFVDQISLDKGKYFLSDLYDKEGKVLKDGRNLFKEPTTAFAFGSAIKSAFRGMTRTIVDSIPKKIEKIHALKMANDPTAEDARKEFIRNFNAQLDKEFWLPWNTTTEQLMAMESKHPALLNFAERFERFNGKAFKEAMTRVFGTFIERRNMVNGQMNFASEVYNAARNNMIQARLDAKIKAGEILMVPGSGPMYGLTSKELADIDRRLDSLLPRIESPYSALSGNKSERFFVPKANPVVTRTKNTRVELKMNVNGKPTSRNGYAETVEMTGPGVAGLPRSIHSSDSAGMHYAADGTQMMNIHDEGAQAADRVLDTAHRLNKSITEVMVRYSVLGENFSMMQRSLNGLARLVKERSITQQDLDSIMDQFDKIMRNTDETGGMSMAARYAEIKRKFIEGERARLETLLDMGYVDQYTWEDGQYQMTEELRQEVQDQLNQLNQFEENLTAEEQADLDFIESVLHKGGLPDVVADVDFESEAIATTLADFDVGAHKDLKSMGVPVLMQHALVEQAIEELGSEAYKAVLEALDSGKSVEAAIGKVTNEQQHKLLDAVLRLNNATNNNKTTPFGVLADGTANKAHTFLDDALAAKPVLTGKEAIALLREHWKGFEIQKVLMAQLMKAIGDNVTVRYITPNTSPRSTPTRLKPDEAATIHFKDDGSVEILLLSPAFANHGETSIALLHELIHAAVVAVMADPKAPKEVKTAIKNLEKLMAELKDKPAFKNFQHAFTNVHEFIAYGLSDKFMIQELKNAQVTTVTLDKRTKLIKAIDAFVQYLADVFYGGKADKMRKNALAITLANTVAVMKYAKENGKHSVKTSVSLSATAGFGKPNLTMQEIFQRLDAGNTTPQFQEYLGGMMDRLQTSLHLPLAELKARLDRGAATDPSDAWAKAIADGQAPFTSRATAVFGMSEQEALAVEQTELLVATALKAKDAIASLATKQLAQMFAEARAKLKPSDFNNPAQYDFIFKLEKEYGDRSEHLARFAALALGHEQTRALLNYQSFDFNTKPTPTAPNLLEKLESLMNRIIQWLTGLRTGAKAGTVANERLLNVVGHLVDMEHKRIAMLNSRSVLDNLSEKTDDFAKRTGENVRKSLGAVAGTSLLANSRWAPIRLASQLTTLVAQDRTEQFVQALYGVRDKHFKERHGVMMGLTREYFGEHPIAKILLRMAKMNEGARKDVMISTKDHVMNGFANKGEDLSKQDHEAMSYVMLRSGMHNLLGAFTQQEVESFMTDPKALDTAINKVKSQLTGFAQQYDALAHSLGYYRAKDRVKGLVLQNAHAISRLVGTEWATQITEAAAAQNEAAIAQLATLYALKHSSPRHLVLMDQVMRKENARTDGGNGVVASLKLAAYLEQDALNRVFNGNKMLMTHGYTPEITNPNTTWQVANDQDGARLMNQGYAQGMSVTKDPADPDPAPKRMYVLRGVGMRPWLSGAFSLTQPGAKGTSMKTGKIVDDAVMINDVQNRRMLETKALMRSPTGNIEALPDGLLPTLNEDGDVVDFRYVMKADTKDELLQRNNHVGDILGTLAGSTFDKESTVDQNQQVVDGLLQHYKDEYKNNPESFVMIGPNSPNTEFQELWKMLPEKTKDYVRAQGHQSIPVKMGMLDTIFGYRKASLGAIMQNVATTAARLDKRGFVNTRQMAKDGLPPMQKLFATAVDIAYLTLAYSKGLKGVDAERWAARSGADLLRAGRVWTEVVKEAKDIIVNKTVIVLMGNMLSNYTLLKIAGVPWTDIVKDMVVAHKAALRFQSEDEEARQLRLAMDVGYITDPTELSKMEQRLIELEDSMDRNPVKTLIDAGLMPTIVEDIDPEADLYSYKTLLQEKFDSATGWVNPTVMKHLKTATLSKGTAGYNFMFRATQLSDFTARYVMYKHLTERKNKPLDHDTAIEDVADAFVNYDLPMQRNLQWLDDSGIFLFSKYAYRIQRVLYKLVREKPLNVFMMILIDKLLNLGPIVTESGIMYRIGRNPLETGIFELPRALDDIYTVNQTLSLLGAK